MTQNQKKIILFALILILLGIQVHRFWGKASKGHGSERQSSSVQNWTHPQEPFQLRLDLLGSKPNKIEIDGSGRNPFIPDENNSGEEKVVSAAKAATSVNTLNLEPELPDLGYVGFVRYGADKLGVFIKEAEPSEILMLRVNDRVGDRFKLIDIKDDWATFCNLNTGKEAQLKIVERTYSETSAFFRHPFPRSDTSSSFRRILR